MEPKEKEIDAALLDRIKDALDSGAEDGSLTVKIRDRNEFVASVSQRLSVEDFAVRIEAARKPAGGEGAAKVSTIR